VSSRLIPRAYTRDVGNRFTMGFGLDPPIGLTDSVAFPATRLQLRIRRDTLIFTSAESPAPLWKQSPECLGGMFCAVICMRAPPGTVRCHLLFPLSSLAVSSPAPRANVFAEHVAGSCSVKRRTCVCSSGRSCQRAKLGGCSGCDLGFNDVRIRRRVLSTEASVSARQLSISTPTP